jgi:hypothetical protein
LDFFFSLSDFRLSHSGKASLLVYSGGVPSQVEAYPVANTISGQVDNTSLDLALVEGKLE